MVKGMKLSTNLNVEEFAKFLSVCEKAGLDTATVIGDAIRQQTLLIGHRG